MTTQTEKPLSKALFLNDNTCWCEFCKQAIKPKENFLLIYKTGYKAVSPSRINICIVCLENLYKSVSRKELKEVKARRTERLI